MKLYCENIEEYLKASKIIDFNDTEISKLANELKSNAESEVDLIRLSFEYVRDKIGHSMDISGEHVTCKSSDVLTYREGFCYAKSHLLAAILRKNGIPAGFCYQRLILDSVNAPYLIIHGLNGVYVSSIDKWVRLDPRGNKEGVNADFLLDTEQLAFTPKAELGEEDILVCYPDPDLNVVEKLSEHSSVIELFYDLPKELAFR